MHVSLCVTKYPVSSSCIWSQCPFVHCDTSSAVYNSTILCPHLTDVEYKCFYLRQILHAILVRTMYIYCMPPSAVLIIRCDIHFYTVKCCA